MATVGQHLVVIAERAEADGAVFAASTIRAAAASAMERPSAVSFTMAAELTSAASFCPQGDGRYLREAAALCRAVAGEVGRPTGARATAA